MGQFFIRGNRHLSGEISVGGSKNAALPIIFSCILIHGKTTLKNLPDISDVDVALDILRDFGASVNRTADVAQIDTSELYYRIPDAQKVAKIRASSYLIGACLSRFGKAELQSFGGCNFDNRPIDMHIAAATSLGARVYGGTLVCDRLCGADIIFDKISVGATVNALLLSASARGESRIYGHAREPHVMSLIDFLTRAGAEIEVFDDHIFVRGNSLFSSEATIISDMIEAGSYLALSLATNSEIKVLGADASQLESFFLSCSSCGAFAQISDGICLSGKISTPMHITTAPYPGFPTDLQPIMAPLMALSYGGSIFEGVFKNRFGYLNELSRFGVKFENKDGYAVIHRSEMHPATATARDLRCGAALVISALCVDGESVICDSEIIKRGYSNIVKKLQKIGAQIEEF